MIELTDKKKIETLERIITAIFGRQEAKIEYRPQYEDMVEITLECDVDDAIKVLGNLKTAEIDSDFYTSEKEMSKDDIKFWGTTGNNRTWEGITEINLYVETRYWQKVKELERQRKYQAKYQKRKRIEIAKLKEEIIRLSSLLEATKRGESSR